MLALAWPWNRSASQQDAALAKRLGASLCAGLGGHAGTACIEGVAFASRQLRWNAAQARVWRPAVLPSGRMVAFNGFFDNAQLIAADLGADPGDAAYLYGRAVERWGEEAERRIIGEYCAAIAEPDACWLRLSRSPLRGPPLYYFHDEVVAAAASVPRAIFAAGIEQRLNEAHLADCAMLNFTDQEASWFEGVAMVPTGSVVELERGRPRLTRKTYDLSNVPKLGQMSDAEVVTRASELLDEGVRACIAGFRKPGATLSAGLDSSQVAVRAQTAIPPGQRLPTFTFHPEEGFDGRAPRGMMGNERPWVERFAALHPGLDPHFTSNAGYGHDHRWKELFHLAGGPSGLNTMYVFHGLMSEAQKVGCDALLLAEWGNLTFSDRGEAGFVEYFLKGRWRQLWLALTRPSNHEGSIMRRFVAKTASALLPNRLWRMLRRLALSGKPLLPDLIRPLSVEYRRSSGAEGRLQDAGVFDRYQPRSRRHSRALLFGNGDPAEIHQGFEQMYGIALRDPTAYRPFVEFCLALPTKMFLRDGEMRWLAKQMAMGIMPDEQRNNALNGWWDADWHVRIGRCREEWLAELSRIERDERLGGMFDVPRLRAALEDWPGQTETDPQRAFVAQLAVPTALLTARFVKYVEGRNEP